MKLVYTTVNGIGITWDAHNMMCNLSALFGATTLVIYFQFVKNRFFITFKVGFFSVLLLGFSYGYWRYAMEAEVYALSHLIILYGLYLGMSKKSSITRSIVIALICILSVSIYKLSFIPTFFVLPIFWLVNSRYREIIIHYVIGFFGIVGAYTVTYNLMSSPPDHLFEHLFDGIIEARGSVVSSIFVLGSNQLSSNWIYGFENAVSFISSVYPHKVIDEEVFMADASSFLKYLSLITFTINVGYILVLLSKGVKIIKNHYVPVLWLVFYGMIVLLFDPTSTEPWLMVQLPLHMVLIGFLLRNDKWRMKEFIMSSFLLFFFLHNFIGGMIPLNNQNRDFYKSKSKEILKEQTANDLIVAYGSGSYVRYLRYYSEGKIFYLEEDHTLLKDAIDKTLKNDGRVLLSSEVIYPPEAILYRSPESKIYLDNLFGSEQYQLIGPDIEEELENIANFWEIQLNSTND